MPIMWKLSGHWISPWAAWISTPCSATLWRRSTNYRKLVLGSVPISPAVLNPFWPNWKSPFAVVSTRQRPTAWCRVTAPKTVKHPNPTGVHMGGYQQLVRGEAMRGKFRNSFSKPEPFTPGKMEKVEWAMPDIDQIGRAHV